MIYSCRSLADRITQRGVCIFPPPNDLEDHGMRLYVVRPVCAAYVGTPCTRLQTKEYIAVRTDLGPGS